MSTLEIENYHYFIDDSISQIRYTDSRVPTPAVSYTYDPNYPRPASMTDGSGVTTYGYFPAGQLGAGQISTIDGPLANDTLTFTYDSLGRELTRAINGIANTSTHQYDTLGRLTQETTPLGTFTLGYAANLPRLTSVDYPNGQRTDYSYFPNVGSVGNGNQGDRRLSQIRHRKPGGAELSQFDYTYTPSGIIQSWSQQRDTDPATLWTLGYDAADQLTAAQVSTNGTAAPSYSYAYDLGSNRTQEQTPENLIFAAHNELNQVTGIAPTAQTTSVHLSGTVDQPSIVTANGQPATNGLPASNFSIDLPLAPGASTVTLSATTPAPDSITTTQHYAISIGNRTTVESLTYDRAGNLTSDQGGTFGPETTYAWDAANRLVKISQPGAVTEFLYDGQSRRVGEKYNGTLIKQWIWFPAAPQPAEERDASNNVTKRFYPSQGEQIAGVPYYYTLDHLGSIREMTDTTGAVRARYTYDPYGNSTKQSGDLESTFGYTGYYNHPSSGLNLALYRAYSPRLGRFLSRDPIEEAGGINLYGYVGWNSLNYRDQYGLEPLTKEQIELARDALGKGGTAFKDMNFQMLNNAALADLQRLQDVARVGMARANSCSTAATQSSRFLAETAAIRNQAGLRTALLGTGGAAGIYTTAVTIGTADVGTAVAVIGGGAVSALGVASAGVGFGVGYGIAQIPTRCGNNVGTSLGNALYDASPGFWNWLSRL